MGTRLFRPEDVKRFFDRLYSMGRMSCKRYDKRCEREVFVRRTVSKYLKGYFVVLYTQDENTGLTYKRYVSINNIRYALDYGNNLEVSITDYARPYSWFNSIKIGHNEALELDGLFTDGEEHKLLYKFMSMDDVKDKEFVYSGYDFTKYPTRKKKGQTEDDIRELMKVEKVVIAKVEADADKQIKKLQGRDFLLQGLKEIREL